MDQKIIDTIVLDMKNGFIDTSSSFSLYRDIFTARIQSYISEKKKYMEAAIISEIGNNTFDHNFIFGNDCPMGVYCNLNYLEKYTVIADYGRGVKESLSQVIQLINSDVEGIELAFTKRISGRSPEQRGNGLKFVSETIKKNHWELYFQSGNGFCIINNEIKFSESCNTIIGCLAIINFNEDI
jgi:hypothetical protein